jgi:putative flippase GtrA
VTPKQAATGGGRAAHYFRFLAVGAVNTAVSYLAYLLLRLVMSYQLAYALAFVLGIAISAAGNARYVFSAHLTVIRCAFYAAFYSISYLAGAGLLHGLVEWAGIPDAVAPLLVIGVMIPLNYLGAKLILQTSAGRGRGAG